MKKLFTILALFIFVQLLNAQNISISSDGNLKSVENNEIPYVLKTNNLSPYHTTPSWTATRERQIAGMAFGDYDSDGDLDLAVGCYYSNSYPPINDYENFIFRNNNGILDTIPAWISGDEKNTNDIKWADINGDGRIDLISANGSFSKSAIYFNSASGLSTTPGWISNDNVWTVGCAVSDVDGNGWLDLAFGNQGLDPVPYKPIQIFFNTGGVLNTIPEWSSGDEMITNSVAFTDMDKSHLVNVNNLSYSADGIGSAYMIPKVPVYKIDSVKVNGIKTDNYCADKLNGWISLGFVPQLSASVEIAYTYIVKGDMAAAKWSSFQSGVYFNNNGVMNVMPGWTNGNTSTEKGVAWADFDLDGYDDLVIGGTGGPHTIFKNINGVLQSSPIWSSAGTNTSTQEIEVADVNRDGYPDLAAVHFGYKRIEIFFNIAGTLESVPSWIYIAGSSATSIEFGDVNGDGWLDLAVGTVRSPITLFIADPSLVPVEFESFTSFVNGNNITLEWVTSSEKNNMGFDIERKNKNEQTWKKIGYLTGEGTTTEHKKYFYNDLSLAYGIYQYRLKQIDYDGTSSYSKIIEVELLNEVSFYLGQNYPNPFNPVTVIEYSVPADQYVEIKLYDVVGNEVQTLTSGNHEKGNYKINFNGSNLSSGIYFYKITDGYSASVRKMILLK